MSLPFTNFHEKPVPKCLHYLADKKTKIQKTRLVDLVDWVDRVTTVVTDGNSKCSLLK